MVLEIEGFISFAISSDLLACALFIIVALTSLKFFINGRR